MKRSETTPKTKLSRTPSADHPRLQAEGAVLSAKPNPLSASADKAVRRKLMAARAGFFTGGFTVASWAPIIRKEDARIDFGQRAETVHNLVRGMAGWPCAFCSCMGKTLKVHRSRMMEGSGIPGTVLDRKRFVVACGEGALELTEVQMEGSKRVSGADFLRGHSVERVD